MWTLEQSIMVFAPLVIATLSFLRMNRTLAQIFLFSLFYEFRNMMVYGLPPHSTPRNEDVDLTQNTIWGAIVRWVSIPLIMSMLFVFPMQLADSFVHDEADPYISKIAHLFHDRPFLSCGIMIAILATGISYFY